MSPIPQNITLSHVQWDVLGDQLGTIMAFVGFSLLHVPINIPSLALTTDTDRRLEQAEEEDGGDNNYNISSSSSSSNTNSNTCGCHQSFRCWSKCCGTKTSAQDGAGGPRELSVDLELKLHGISNLIGGLVAFLPNYLVYVEEAKRTNKANRREE